MFYICSTALWSGNIALISEAKRQANRANAARSTGPRTTDGKNVVRLNAVKHGLCAAQAVLPGEHEAAFEALRVDLLARLAPEGDGQRQAVEQVARELWRLRRAGLSETGALAQLANPFLLQSEKDDPATREVHVLGATLWQDFGESGFLDKLSRYEARSGRALERALRVLERLRALNRPSPAPAGEGGDPRSGEGEGQRVPRSRAPSSAQSPDPHPDPLPQSGRGGRKPQSFAKIGFVPSAEARAAAAAESSPARSSAPRPDPLPGEGKESQFSPECGFVRKNRAGLFGSVSSLALALGELTRAPEIRWPPGWERP